VGILISYIMKKIDLHIHTVPSLTSDNNFTFELSKLKEYVEKMEIDCIAITNHNLFDKNQFEEICKELSNTKIFPGIEIDLERGHILLISENKDLEEFQSRCSQVQELIKTKDDCITYEQLVEIFNSLDSSGVSILLRKKLLEAWKDVEVQYLTVNNEYFTKCVEIIKKSISINLEKLTDGLLESLNIIFADIMLNKKIKEQKIYTEYFLKMVILKELYDEE